MKHVPARTYTARELGLDIGEQTLNTKGAGLHGCWSSRAQRLSCREPLLSRATRSAISSMRASSCSSFCVSRRAHDAQTIAPRPWRADAQYEGRWASWLLVLSRAALVLSRATPVASHSVGDLVHAGFELL